LLYSRVKTRKKENRDIVNILLISFSRDNDRARQFVVVLRCTWYYFNRDNKKICSSRAFHSFPV